METQYLAIEFCLLCETIHLQLKPADMRFVETPVFSKPVKALLPDEDYRAFQIALLLRPELGSAKCARRLAA